MLCFFSRPFFLSCTTQKNRGCCYATDSSVLYSGCCCCYIDHRRVHKKKAKALLTTARGQLLTGLAAWGSSILRWCNRKRINLDQHTFVWVTLGYEPVHIFSVQTHNYRTRIQFLALVFRKPEYGSRFSRKKNTKSIWINLVSHINCYSFN